MSRSAIGALTDGRRLISMFGGKSTEHMRCSLLANCDLYAGKIWGAEEEPLSSICVVLWD